MWPEATPIVCSCFTLKKSSQVRPAGQTGAVARTGEANVVGVFEPYARVLPPS